MSFQDLRNAGRKDGGGATSRTPGVSPVKASGAQATAWQGKQPGAQANGINVAGSSRADAYGAASTQGVSGTGGISGASQPGPSGAPTSDPEVSRGVFQMNTAVSSFKRLVNSLGTPKDTPDLRQKLQKSRQYVTQLGKEIGAKLKDASTRDHQAGVSTAKKLSDAKLAKDFQAVLREFEKAQHLAVEREAAYRPRDDGPATAGARKQQAQAGGARRTLFPADSSSSSESLSDPLLRQQQRQEMLRVESEVAYTEAVIEEREQGIQEIQHQIAEVNEIFRDLAVLVKEQGVMIDDIEANIENTHAQTVQANKQLMKAAKAQKDSNSFVCWIMAVFAIGLFIFFLVMSS